LPGVGQSSPLIDEPYDRFWWVRRKLRLAKTVDHLSSSRRSI
jgi:hypothetical protein